MSSRKGRTFVAYPEEVLKGLIIGKPKSNYWAVYLTVASEWWWRYSDLLNEGLSHEATEASLKTLVVSVPALARELGYAPAAIRKALEEVNFLNNGRYFGVEIVDYMPNDDEHLRGVLLPNPHGNAESLRNLNVEEAIQC